MTKKTRSGIEIALIGEVEDWEEEVIKVLLKIPFDGECTFYIDSGGGSVSGAVAVVTLLRQRRIRATAIVLGECSSATLLIFAACQKRQVTRYSTLFFHRMRWQSEKKVSAAEALHWAQHFDEIERQIDDLQIRLFGTAEDLVRAWTTASQYVTGLQAVEAGLAELIEI